MMHKLLSLLLLVPVFVSCSQMAEQRQFKARKAFVHKSLAEYRSAVQQAAAARIVVVKPSATGQGELKRVFNFPQAEFTQLRGILSRTQPMPISREEPVMMTVSWACYFRLELLDAGGRVLASKDPSVTWTSETRMLNLPVDYQSTLFDPTWYLQDADFLAMVRLPTMRAANKWVNGGK